MIPIPRNGLQRQRDALQNAIDHTRARPYSCRMIAELDTLEAKIRLVAERCEILRTDNLSLRQQLLAVQQENKQLHHRLDTAKTRVQTLLDKIPEDV